MSAGASPGRRWRRPGGVTVAAGTLLLAVIGPFVALGWTAWQRSPELWTHLLRYVLPGATFDTAALLAGVGLLATVIGAGLAWLVTSYEFPARRLLDGCLVLPLAVPTYIVAYAYLDILHPVGPVQDALRWLFGYDSPRDFRLPDIRSMTGCILVLGFVLYPYVYLPVRATFAMQSASLIESGRTLGLTRRQVLFRVALPLARPAVAVGLSLALMETLNDIGASEFMGIRTLTVSIYSTWVTRSDLAGASQIALGLLAVVLAMVMLERWARRHQRYSNDAQHPRPIARLRLSGPMAVLGTLVTTLPVLIGFGAPFVYLLHAAATRIRVHGIAPALMPALGATVLLSLLATVAGLLAGVVVAYAARIVKVRAVSTILTMTSIGYATPGTVVAIGILPLAAAVDGMLGDATNVLFGRPLGLVMLGTGAAVLYAYVVRFLAITAGGTEAALAKVPPSLDDAAATLGAAPRERVWRVHLPLVRRALLASAVLMFVDCMKELPATLLLRPLGVETLSTLLYGEAARGTYEDGAIAALLIVAVAVVPVWVLNGLAGDTPGRGLRRAESSTSGRSRGLATDAAGV